MADETLPEGDDDKPTPEAAAVLSPAQMRSKIFELEHKRLMKRQAVPFEPPPARLAPTEVRARPGDVSIAARVVRGN